MWLWLILAALPVDAVILGDVAADPCAWAERIPQSLDRLPTLTVTATAAVRVEVQVGPQQLRLRLTDGAQLLAARQLPNDGACEARADGIALVVEQQLRSLGYVPPLPPPLPPPARTASVAVAAAPPLVRTPTVALAPPPPPTPPPPAPPPVAPAPSALGPLHGWVGAAAVVEAPGEAGVRFGGQGELALRADRFGLVVQGGAVARQRLDVVRAGVIRGSLSVWSLLVTAGAEACLGLPGGAGCAQVRAGAERVEGTSSGAEVFRPGVAASVRPAVALGVRYRLLRFGPLALEATAEALLRPVPAAFEVEDGAAYRDPPVAVRLGLGGAARIF